MLIPCPCPHTHSPGYTGRTLGLPAWTGLPRGSGWPRLVSARERRKFGRQGAEVSGGGLPCRPRRSRCHTVGEREGESARRACMAPCTRLAGFTGGHRVRTRVVGVWEGQRRRLCQPHSPPLELRPAVGASSVSGPRGPGCRSTPGQSPSEAKGCQKGGHGTGQRSPLTGRPSHPEQTQGGVSHGAPCPSQPEPLLTPGPAGRVRC